MLEMRKMRKSFGKKQSPVLREVSFQLQKGETLALTGPSGCGKSTLARVLLLLLEADAGEIFFQGKKLNPKSRKERKQYRKKIQYISQHPESFFDPSWKLGKSLREPWKILGMEPEEEKIPVLLEKLKVSEAVQDRYPHQVSGGEIQRAALCRALLVKPDVLVLDEVTSMLDVSVQAQIVRILQKLQGERELSYLLISHDEKLVGQIAGRILRLEGGKITEI